MDLLSVCIQASRIFLNNTILIDNCRNKLKNYRFRCLSAVEAVLTAVAVGRWRRDDLSTAERPTGLNWSCWAVGGRGSRSKPVWAQRGLSGTCRQPQSRLAPLPISCCNYLLYYFEKYILCILFDFPLSVSTHCNYLLYYPRKYILCILFDYGELNNI